MKHNSVTIRAINLVKKFGDFTAVNRVSFQVNQGEIFGFLGPNGSGKTTTIRMMLGLIQPTSGDMEILGLPVDGQTRKILPRIGYMSQQFSLYNDLNVYENLVFYGQAYGINRQDMKERIQDAISLAGLEGYENSPTKELSGGWRQRLALSAAILHQPEVLFLDEPTAGVDPVSRREFWDLLYKLVADGITVFITTHYMDEAEHCHRLAFIRKGEIISRGSPSEIKSLTMPGEVIEIQSSDTQKLLSYVDEAISSKKLSANQAELYGSMLHVVSQQADMAIKTIKKQAKALEVTIDSINVVEPTLEDVFIACMQEGLPEE
jgi:ABC-2 type transport system ATP-binding protein